MVCVPLAIMIHDEAVSIFNCLPPLPAPLLPLPCDHQAIQLSEEEHCARFNFKRLANELDALFIDVPEAEGQAARMLKDAAAGPLRLTKWRRLRHVLSIGGPAYAGRVNPLGKPLEPSGSPPGSLKMPASTAGSPLKGASRRAVGRGIDDGDDDKDVAGRLSRLLIDRFGVSLPKVQVRNFDDLMGEIRKRLNSGGSSDTSGSSSGAWPPYPYPPYGYAPPYGYGPPQGYPPYGYPPQGQEQLYAGSVPAPPAQDLLLQHQVGRCMLK